MQRSLAVSIWVCESSSSVFRAPQKIFLTINFLNTDSARFKAISWPWQPFCAPTLTLNRKVLTCVASANNGRNHSGKGELNALVSITNNYTKKNRWHITIASDWSLARLKLICNNGSSYTGVVMDVNDFTGDMMRALWRLRPIHKWDLVVSFQFNNLQFSPSNGG